MNSYTHKIAAELRRLKNIGADIPDNIISLANKGRYDLGAMAADNLKGLFDVTELRRLNELASREDYPAYWARVDAAGGWSNDNKRQNVKALKAATKVDPIVLKIKRKRS